MVDSLDCVEMNFGILVGILHFVVLAADYYTAVGTVVAVDKGEGEFADVVAAEYHVCQIAGSPRLVADLAKEVDLTAAAVVVAGRLHWLYH